MGWTLNEAKKLPILMETDVLVVGGGRQVLPPRLHQQEMVQKQY